MITSTAATKPTTSTPTRSHGQSGRRPRSCSLPPFWSSCLSSPFLSPSWPSCLSWDSSFSSATLRSYFLANAMRGG